MSQSAEHKAVIEGLIFVSGEEGIEKKQIADVLQISMDAAEELLDELVKDYKSDTRGMEIIEIAGSFQFVTKREHAGYYERLVSAPSHSSLSQAALETLAIIAYKQPITRAEIEEVRGVKTEKPLQTLSSKGLIKETGRAEGTGRAILYGTTKNFLEHFGLKSLHELPPLPEKVNDQSIEEEADLFFSKFQETME
ncbi:SMC-Scp complex subunit ScpB [Fictibacillus sp. WQ 8-8]|uniref:Segregation and condensation protein B n=1 Tax=Fictibacillus marinisediminis TaxID=2878389 RepID=A0A9X1XAZ5_9BACL|nr:MULTISPECIES: SMC-Scp complex subunit ScpB [Fictibacillus]MCK6257567.1 SMC-Scp complex subunit ScpB [Fictibacillus marinisediminis]MCQ6266083.1 SMC-Scp complex subunit ScpB [Fictibacillus sp. WQ 8-8]MED2972697.1 SMC-Scp complex subunit ScpB [Fictibacillus sp. B-59209]SFD72244.1 segregation and condensation protein B [Bacillus sp. OV194]